MIYFLHTFQPNPILFSAGPVHFYWYGLIVVLAIISGMAVTIFLANKYQIEKAIILDLAFWLILGGILGARLYDGLLELPYYLANPLNILKIWQGGLAIHGAIFTCLIILWWFAKKIKINFWLLGSIIVPGLALGQAIGRWGNYFNQELFGQPTNLPWGIPIDLIRRPADFLGYNFFQPTFLYESLGNLLIFISLIGWHYLFQKKSTQPSQANYHQHFLIVMAYLCLYSVLRFTLEFIRIDYAPTFLGLRAPQIVSLLIIIGVLILSLTKNKLANQAIEK